MPIIYVTRKLSFVSNKDDRIKSVCGHAVCQSFFTANLANCFFLFLLPTLTQKLASHKIENQAFRWHS